MATMKSSGDLIASIGADMADNNAGLISAEDVRHNMEDTVFSINRIVASGDTDVQFPFFNDVRAKKDTVAGAKGRFIAEAGVLFPNAPVNPTVLQVEPYPGVGNIDHNQLKNLDVGHVHTQYYHVDGVDQANNVLNGNVPVGNNWINASGYDNVGLKFEPRSSDGKTRAQPRLGPISMPVGLVGICQWFTLRTTFIVYRKRPRGSLRLRLLRVLLITIILWQWVPLTAPTLVALSTTWKLILSPA